MKKLFLMSAATAALVLASCTKEGGKTTPSTEDFSVTISFNNAEATRADSAAAVAGTKIGIEDGYLCFVNGGDAITDVYTISAAATADKNIQNTDLGTTAVTLQNIPGNSTMVYMIANKGTLAATPAVGGVMATFLNNTVAVTDQGDYTKVTCVSSAALTPVSDGVKAANIALATNVSRIQVKDLSFEGVTGEVAGIFINGFYTAMELDGGVAPAAPLQSSVDKTKYVAGSDIFTTGLNGYVYDTFFSTIIVPGFPMVPNTIDGVFGYNLFASPTPQIIIKLTDVVAGTQTYADPQFVTVNGFKDPSSANVTTLAGGMIYTIGAGALVIKPEHLSPDPGVKPIVVDVTVDQAEWEETVVTPNL